MGNGNPNWVPGVSGNPAGRPKGTNRWAEIMNECLSASELTLTIGKKNSQGEIVETDIYLSAKDEKTIRHAITMKQLELALNGDMQAIKDIIDRDSGKPKETLNIENLEQDKLNNLMIEVESLKGKD